MKPDLAVIYDAIYEEEDARTCRDIPDDACAEVPNNFFLTAAALSLAKLGEAIANTKTTLPWLLSAVGAPGWMAGILVPLRESGSMLPQLAIGGWVRRHASRKGFYVFGALAQALSLGVAAAGLWILEGALAGWLTILCVITFSLARGFCSVASKDVLGKTVPKQRRGRVTGLASSCAGLGTLLIAGYFYVAERDEGQELLVLAGAVLWLLAGLVYAGIREQPGATEGGANGLSAALARLALLREDVAFRGFVLGRALLMGTALMAPFLVVLAQQNDAGSLLLFLAAQGTAALLSGNFWGVLADWSSRRVMAFCGAGACVLGGAVFLTAYAAPTILHSAWFLPGAFFVLAVLHDGVRLGRKTYLVDLGDGNKRTDYVSVANTVIGALLLLFGGIVAALQNAGAATAVLVCGLSAGAALWFVLRLPEVQ